MLRFLARQWFLFSLAAVLLIGYTQASALERLSEAAWLRDLIVASVLFLMAFPLSLAAITRAVKRPTAAGLACALNYVAVPLVGWPLALLLSPEMSLGVMVAVSTPCTLASAAVWTRKAGGNDAVALVVTLVTNLACFLIMPAWLLAMTGTSVEIPFDKMVLKLAMLVVLPIVVAQLLRLSPPVAAWATANKTPMSVAAQLGILSMIGLGSIAAGLKLNSDLQALFAVDKLAMVAVIISVHLVVLFFGLWLGRLLRIDRPDTIAMAIAGSQKTLMIGLAMATDYFAEYGLVMLPIVVYHAGQLLADTVIADWLKRRDIARTSESVNKLLD